MARSLSELRLQALAEKFDPDFYVKTYSDIAKAVAAGQWPDPREHYIAHGAREGRLPFKFQSEWYLAAYPFAKAEIAEGLVANALEHYAILGAARGYLPYPDAERPDNAAAPPSRFGGLWIDEPNAFDRIEGRFETGVVSRQEADLLHMYREQGYVILKNAIEPPLLARGQAAIDRAYRGEFEGLLFECHAVSRKQIPWRAEMNEAAAKALDAHMFSADLRDLMFAAAVQRFLGLLFEMQPLASQSLAFWRGSAQSAHQDSAYVLYSIPRQFAAAWIALEDVSADAGELAYYPGSHRFPEFLYDGRYKSQFEARRRNPSSNSLAKDETDHVESLPKLAAARGMKYSPFLAKAGDVLIWHADLAHGGMPISREITRKSFVVHYCPSNLAPLYFEAGNRQAFRHRRGGWYSSGMYPAMEPRA